MSSLEGHVAIVTGAAKRIGRAIALTLAREGATVAVHYRSSRDAAQKTAHEAGGGATTFRADLSDLGSLTALADDVTSQLGTPSILVNSAAVFARTPFPDVTEDAWDKQFDINLKGTFFLTQAVCRHMKRGLIVNIADSAGLSVWPGYIPYSVSKGGVISMTRGLAKALAPDIRVNAILPGPMLQPEGEGEMESIENGIKKTLLKRQGSPEDIAKAVRYFAVDGDYVTGAILPVDGGRSARD